MFLDWIFGVEMGCQNEDKGKHGKFGNLWKGPFKVAAFRGQNAYLLEYLSDQPVGAAPMNDRLLKHFLSYVGCCKTMSLFIPLLFQIMQVWVVIVEI